MKLNHQKITSVKVMFSALSSTHLCIWSSSVALPGLRRRSIAGKLFLVMLTPVCSCSSDGSSKHSATGDKKSTISSILIELGVVVVVVVVVEVVVVEVVEVVVVVVVVVGRMCAQRAKCAGSPGFLVLCQISTQDTLSSVSFLTIKPCPTSSPSPL